ncbi:MAG: recF [Candidatus Saccharibacteria bacterium]|nr:recF [Candidatus Saccharibacteria bacterium]
MVAIGRSFRARDEELKQFEAEWARLDAHTITGQRSVLLEEKVLGVQKSFVIDEQKLSRLTLHKTLPVVLFEPNHLLLLHGSPELRRAYLDDLLEQLITGYKQVRRHYRRALSQRNALLKLGYAQAKHQLFAWNLRLSELGEQVVRYRQQLVDDINVDMAATYSELADKKTAVVGRYLSDAAVESYGSYLLKKLESHNELDCQRGFTAYGPQRDDLELLINDKPASQVASRGELRSLVLALKIIELKLMERIHNKPPLLLLDDVFSELDGARRRALTEHLKDNQTFITTTDADVVVKGFTSKALIIPLEASLNSQKKG